MKRSCPTVGQVRLLEDEKDKAGFCRNLMVVQAFLWVEEDVDSMKAFCGR